VVAVGQVDSVGEIPPQDRSARNVAIVQPPFRGAGVTLAIVSVAKGQVQGSHLRVWDLSYGECFQRLAWKDDRDVDCNRPLAGGKHPCGGASDLGYRISYS
jgi:hypothetical protein